MPSCLKRATITPLLKRSGLDEEHVKIYRPISNLRFIPKLIEKVVARRTEEHLEHNVLYDSYQSVYCRGHSKETVLLNVQSDNAEALHGGYMTALVILDLSAAFDVINLSLKCLEFSFVIKERP